MTFPFLNAWRNWRNRRRYDLSQLRQVDAKLKAREAQQEAPEADDPKAAPRNHIYCRHCGDSMSEAYSICPSCGVPLGS